MSVDGSSARFIALLFLGFTSFTLLAWLFSRLVFPLFVPRFFTPQLFTTFALHVAFGAWLLSNLGPRREIIAALCILIAPLMLNNVLVHTRASMHRQPICANEQGGYFESSQVQGDLAIISGVPSHIPSTCNLRRAQRSLPFSARLGCCVKISGSIARQCCRLSHYERVADMDAHDASDVHRRDIASKFAIFGR